MAHIYLCFLWHMHQPFYKDLVTGEYKLPWSRMHALKDYYGMARILEEFPEVRQTFNLVPSMMAQVAEYASGDAADPFLEAALKPAENLTDADRAFLLQHSFYSDPERMIYRYPRYGELYGAWEGQKRSGSRNLFGPQDFRDLQMWSQLAWFDEEFQAQDPEVREWVRRGRDFTPADQRRMGEKQREMVGQVLPVYRRLARGRSRFRPPPITIRSCRCCAIRTSPTWRIPTCRFRRGSATPKMRAASSCWRGSTSSASSARRRWGCGPRRVLSPTRFSRLPPSWVLNGRRPTAGC
jgi:alpha-amylase/alpha-mannosidase (GH57 family)